MERAMGDDFYFLRFEHRPLTPEEWDHLKRSAVCSAREHRVQLLRSLFVAILAPVRSAAVRTVAAAGRHWRAYATWRARRRAIKELGALDDRVLKDIGVHRSEIESVVYGPDLSREREGAVSLPLMLYAKRSVAAKAAPKQLTERSAA
jgi:uncharacterized protein YjiS (DUF1127 family)